MNENGGYTTSYIPFTNRAHYRRARAALKQSACAEICERCGTNCRLEAHHKDEDIKNSHITNLAWLCRTCHKKLHEVR